MTVKRAKATEVSCSGYRMLLRISVEGESDTRKVLRKVRCEQEADQPACPLEPLADRGGT